MNGTEFDFSFAPGITEQQIIGFEMAGEIWSQYLTDEVSISIHVETLDLPDDAIGGATPAFVANQSYEEFLGKAANDILSAEDAIAFASLQQGTSYDRMIGSVIDSNNEKIMLTNANAKALGIEASQDYGGLDVTIQIDSNTPWSYDFLRNNAPNPNEYDLLSVAIHEIGHGLGFISGLDTNSTIANSSTLDMFRYSQQSFSQGMHDFSFGTEAYFSIDGGQTSITEFSRGHNDPTIEAGYNYQASHWADNQDMGIMNPTISQGEFVNISTTDLLAMDVIGWDINCNATIDLASIFQQAQANVVGANIVDRSSDVVEMKADSEVYFWWGQNNNGGNSWWQKGTANASEAETTDSPTNDSLTIDFTFVQDIAPVVQQYIFSDNYDLVNDDITGAAQSRFNSKNRRSNKNRRQDWLSSGNSSSRRFSF
ncbi:MAG: NF038122 family metalloprotease [Cyanobacteria bacterium P01_F01_bin.143]